MLALVPYQPSESPSDRFRVSRLPHFPCCPPPSVCGVAARRRFSGRALRPGGFRLPAKRRRQAAVDDLVEQRLVAPLEDRGRRGSIPVHPMKHVLKRTTLGLARGPPRDL